MVVKKESVDVSKFSDSHKTNTVSYGIEYDDNGTQTAKQVTNAGCFGGLASSYGYLKGQPTAFYCCIRSQYADEAILSYWDAIFNVKTSPWRSLFKDGVHYETFKNSKNPHFKIKIDKDTSAQAVISLAMAARADWDVPDSVAMYAKLKNAGWSDAEALYTSIYVGWSTTDPKNRLEKGSTITMRGRDWAAFSTYGTNVYSYLEKGTPRTDPKNTFGKAYGGLQVIWQKDNALHNYADPGRTNGPTYKVLVRFRKYDGLFAKRHNQMHGSSNHESAVPDFDTILGMKKEIINA